MMRRIGATLAWELWLPATLVLLWYFASAGSQSPFFPPLQTILHAFSNTWFGAGFATNVVPSATNLGIGLAVAIAVGVVGGLLLGMVPLLGAIADPFIQFFRAVPSIALLPMIFVLLGSGPTGRILAIFSGAVWPVLLNTLDGVRGIEPALRMTARSYRLHRYLVVTKVLLPGAMPQAVVGIRTALSIAVIVMVGSEMFATASGIGRFIIVSQQTFAIADMWSGIILMGILGYLLNAVFGLLERRLLRWRPPATTE